MTGRRSFARRSFSASPGLRPQRASNLGSRRWRTVCLLAYGYCNPCERRRDIVRDPLVSALRRLLQNPQTKCGPLRLWLETNPHPEHSRLVWAGLTSCISMPWVSDIDLSFSLTAALAALVSMRFILLDKEPFRRSRVSSVIDFIPYRLTSRLRILPTSLRTYSRILWLNRR